MDIDSLINNLNVKYYNNLNSYLTKTKLNIDSDWLTDYIKELDNINTETETRKTSETTESEIKDKKEIRSIFTNEGVYNKPWQKLNQIHKVLKIKEFVNNLSNISDEDKKKLSENLVELVKNKILTKKENVVYDDDNCKVIGIKNLKYENNKYAFC